MLNLEEAKFDCTFGRGCEGICCKDARPPVYAEELEVIAANVEKFLPHMRADARAAVKRTGFLVPKRRRLKQRMLRVIGGWCVFFNNGCVLHQVGDAEGDKFRYKPALCALFPIQQDRHDNWYIRQKGFKRESWDLFCLNPANCTTPAAESLRDEIALAKRFDDEARLSS